MKRIGEILIDNKLITSEQLELALTAQSKGTKPKKIGEILIDMGFLTYDILLDYLEKQLP